jgi:hypothetical protein
MGEYQSIQRADHDTDDTGDDIVDSDDDIVTTIQSMERYDATSGQWTALAGINTGRRSHGACVIAREIYVTGGMDARYSSLSSVEKYSPFDDSWSPVTNMPEGRCSHAAVAVGSDMYVLGGWSDRRDIAMSSVLKFNSTEGTWSQVAPMPQARFSCAACAIEGNIHIFGGRSPNRLPQPSIFKYDTVPTSGLLSRPCPEPAVVVMDGLVYIVGAREQVRGVLRWDPASNVWSTLGSTLDWRQYGCAFVLGGCIYAAGGNKSNSSNMERYDAATNTWTAVADMLERRYLVAVTIGTAGPAEAKDLFDALIVQASSRRP